MNKSEMVAAIAERANLSQKDAEKALVAFIEETTNALKNGEKVQLVGFGSFEVKTRAARKGRNPQTKAVITIPASKAPVFKAGKSFKDEVSKSQHRKPLARFWSRVKGALEGVGCFQRETRRPPLARISDGMQDPLGPEKQVTALWPAKKQHHNERNGKETRFFPVSCFSKSLVVFPE